MSADVYRPVDRSNVCAIVVTYHPDDSCAAYLATITAQFPRVLVVDNGSRPGQLEALQQSFPGRVEILSMPYNVGLGAALNRGIEAARACGFAWVVLFDQDSEPMAHLPDHYAAVLASHPAPERVAIVGARFSDRNKPRAVSSVATAPDEALWTERRRVITSGSLLSLAAYDRLGGFREDYFIDAIDHEYCLRARSQGWLVLDTTATVLAHSVGAKRPHSFLGKTVWRSHHSAVRCFFMARNRVLLAREYRQGKLWREGLRCFREAFWIVLFEQDKWAKLRATLSGYLAGVLDRTAMPPWIARATGTAERRSRLIDSAR